MIDRPNWNTYFMDMARVASTRATCPRKSVGAVVTDKNNWTIGTGYNGAPSKADQCDQVGCDLNDTGHCTRTLHAECNALLHADSSKISGGRLYIWGYTPCLACARIVVTLGISRVFATEVYDRKAVAFLEKSGVKVVLVK